MVARNVPLYLFWIKSIAFHFKIKWMLGNHRKKGSIFRKYFQFKTYLGLLFALLSVWRTYERHDYIKIVMPTTNTIQLNIYYPTQSIRLTFHYSKLLSCNGTRHQWRQKCRRTLFTNIAPLRACWSISDSQTYLNTYWIKIQNYTQPYKLD